MALYNQFDNLPYIPYNIIYNIFDNENLWKLIYYPDYDCLSKPALTNEQKSDLIWKNQDRMEEYNIFLTSLNENMIPISKTFIMLYDVDISPDNHIVSTVAYEFRILTGGKISMAESNGIPCNRLDLIKMEILKSLNGKDIAGVGVLQFNQKLTRLCASRTGTIGNNRDFTGTNLVLATQVGSVNSKC